ncbi:hypothetical protein JCM33374_g6475 [Metschnikowia sp. JCM 33374]|nr:hypothetical protein JCM33374_g6475 [Metschnikowia sp. JCM 33374]
MSYDVLFMIGELSALRGAIETLDGNECIRRSDWECGDHNLYVVCGFRVSFITDNFLGCSCACLDYYVQSEWLDPDRHLKDRSFGLEYNKLGWQLLYILPVAIATNDCFMSGFCWRIMLRPTKTLSMNCYIANLRHLHVGWSSRILGRG